MSRCRSRFSKGSTEQLYYFAGIIAKKPPSLLRRLPAPHSPHGFPAAASASGVLTRCFRQRQTARSSPCLPCQSHRGRWSNNDRPSGRTQARHPGRGARGPRRDGHLLPRQGVPSLMPARRCSRPRGPDRVPQREAAGAAGPSGAPAAPPAAPAVSTAAGASASADPDPNRAWRRPLPWSRSQRLLRRSTTPAARVPDPHRPAPPPPPLDSHRLGSWPLTSALAKRVVLSSGSAPAETPPDPPSRDTHSGAPG